MANKRIVVTFGDVVPSALNVVGAGAQTLTHAQRTKITEKIPHQTQAKVGILKVSNDRTHLEGIWDVDQAEIETKLFTTSAPKYEAEQTTETEGFSVSLSPAALLSAAIAPGIVSNLACLPSSVSVSGSEGHIERTAYLPMRFNANRLFVQCDNAVFSGSQIRSNVVKMIVTGDLTIESLRDILKEENSNSAINGSLAAVFSSVHKIDNRATLDPKLGAIPTLRIADEEEIIEKVNTLAELVGEEKFYLKVGGLLYQRGADVGLKPDGLVTKSESEKIEADRILNANIPETHSHKRKVINPTVGELVACMGQIDEFKQIRAQIATEMLKKSKTPEETEKVIDSVKKEDVDKIASLKKRMLESQRKIVQKAKEVANKTSDIKIPEDMEIEQLQKEIVRCTYVEELNSEVAKSLVEQEAIKKEYETFSRTLDPEVKSYFDEIIEATSEFGTTIADACHKFNDFWDRAEEIGWMYAVCDDDTLLDAGERQAFKEQVINREIRERQHGLIEAFGTVLRVGEIVSLVSGSASVMRNASREMNIYLSTRAFGQSFNQKLKMSVQYAFEDAGILTKDGRLTEKAISESVEITPWRKLGDKTVKSELSKINPNQQWSKFKTKNISVIKGSNQNAEIHFYKNIETNEIVTDFGFKAKINGNSGIGIFRPINVK